MPKYLQAGLTQSVLDSLPRRPLFTASARTKCQHHLTGNGLDQIYFIKTVRGRGRVIAVMYETP